MCIGTHASKQNREEWTLTGIQFIRIVLGEHNSLCVCIFALWICCVTVLSKVLDVPIADVESCCHAEKEKKLCLMKYLIIAESPSS